jgi:aspartyl-tRNA(Asn)/glutamyl-tRNA(Gln) amidotransferase subunit A
VSGARVRLTSVAGLAGRLRAGELSPREAVEASLERIAALDGHLNAFISVRAEEALREAELAASAGDRGPLWGVPLAVKDVIDVVGARTTAGSRLLADNVAAADAEVVARLRRAGAIVVGKTNTHEFAYGPTTTSEHFGPAWNPWALDRVPGGSSGGSAAAVAAGLVPGALGTDTAGSIRIPAAFCGVTGIRPSTGLVPTRGMLPLSWSVDTIGPMARDAADCHLLLAAIADPGFHAEAPGPGPAALTVGVVESLFEHADAPVADAAWAAVEELRRAGARTRAVEPPHLDRAGLVQQALQFPEATAAHLEGLRTRLADYGADVRGRLLAGLFVPATAYVNALRVRGVLATGFAAAAEGVDVLAAPTLPVVAPRFADGRIVFDGPAGDSPPALAENLFRQRLLRHTAPWCLVGWPAVSVPCGFVDGLPAGLSLVARRGRDAGALRAAIAFQQLTDWHERLPPEPGPV